LLCGFSHVPVIVVGDSTVSAQRRYRSGELPPPPPATS
jgi:hypothetical protein